MLVIIVAMLTICCLLYFYFVFCFSLSHFFILLFLSISWNLRLSKLNIRKLVSPFLSGFYVIFQQSLDDSMWCIFLCMYHARLTLSRAQAYLHSTISIWRALFLVRFQLFFFSLSHEVKINVTHMLILGRIVYVWFLKFFLFFCCSVFWGFFCSAMVTTMSSEGEMKEWEDKYTIKLNAHILLLKICVFVSEFCETNCVSFLFVSSTFYCTTKYHLTLDHSKPNSFSLFF